MKTIANIFRRPDQPLTRLSIFRNGSWVFASLPQSAIVRQEAGMRFARVSEKFGLVKKGQTNPKKISKRGEPGDYISVDRSGVLQVVPKKTYQLMFPAANQNPTQSLTTSKALNDPNFLTDIFESDS